jgi:hypothetical protein
MNRHLSTLARAFALLLLALSTGCDSKAGMIEVAANSVVGTSKTFLIDKYENSLRERKKRNTSGTFDIVFVAESRSNVVPKSGVNYAEAVAYCKEAGKRICTLKEWLSACVGPGNLKSGVQPSPSSPTRIDGLCAVNRTGIVSATTLSKTGTNSRCRTADLAVFDMVGNLSEWVLDEENSTGYPVGSSLNTPLVRAVCDTYAGYDTDGDDDPDSPLGTSDNAPELGFRCCNDFTS